jgi:archaellum component FlaG (FlaF/FlaG flagellin family)
MSLFRYTVALIGFLTLAIISYSQTEIIFQTQGSSFSPLIQLKAPATVLWTFSDGTTSSSLNPTKDYGSSSARANRLSVDPWSAVKMINIGYDAGDGGSNAIPYVTDQHVSKVTNLSLVKDYLEIWCSSYNQIDTLVFDDFILLDSVECFLSQSTRHVSLRNTPSLTRLCLEDNNLTTLDLSGCTALSDLRGAVNNYPSLTFSNSTEEVWHICIRDNPQLTNDSLFTHMERFPNIRELYIWNDNQRGTFRMTPQNVSPTMQLYADGNHYSRLILKGSLTNASGNAWVRFEGNMLQSVDLEGCTQINDLYLRNNQLVADSVDKVLYQLDQLGTTNRYVDLRGNWPPTITGMTYRANLLSKGWTVLTESLSEMDITGNGNTISDGDATPSTSDFTDFGAINVGEGGITRQFLVRNTGSEALTFSGSSPYITIGGNGAANFTVTEGLSSSIAPGGSGSFTIHFDATMNGIFNATLSIANNDFNENPYNFSIRATATIENPNAIIDFSAIADEIVFQTESDSFSPRITLSAPATVLWTFADGTSTNSLTPVKSYPSDASRGNRLKVTPWSALRTINIGYNAGDGGSYAIPFVANQHVSKVRNLSLVKDNLEVWCSSYNQLDTLIFDDFVVLDTVECFLSQTIKHVSLKNTPALTRLCLEDNNLSTLDISECTSLMDLRGAVNNYPTISFSNSGEEIWHICVRDNPQITNPNLFANLSQFPNIAELFIWNDNQSGTFRLSQNHPTRFISLLANWNHYTRLDLRGSLQNEAGDGEISFENNDLRSVDLEGCDQLKRILLTWNGIPSDTINKILRQVDEFGTSNGTLNLAGNRVPTEAGEIHLANLRARGWTVTVEQSPEFDLFGNGVSITNRDNTPTVTDSTDFGAVTLGNTAYVRYIIKNNGNMNLNSSGAAPYIRIGGEDAAYFSIAENVTFPIAPFSSDTLVVAFFPNQKRIYSTELFINTNDGDEGDFYFRLKGSGKMDNGDIISSYNSVTDEMLFLTEGSGFSPLIQLNQTATVLWTFADGTTSSSLNPTKDYGSNASRMNRLKVTPWDAVSMINIGYNGGDGGWSLPHVDNQQVSYLKNTHLVKNSLQYWCSSFNLLDTLNFDNFTNLEDIECYLSYTVSKVSLKNTPKLRRLCLEDNNLSEYDISESPALEDIRGALNNYSTINFPNSTEEFWHICVRENPQLTNDSLFAHLERFPNIADLFIWNTNQSGTFSLAQNNLSRDVYLLCDGNHFSALDLRGSLQNENRFAEISFSGNPLRSVDLEGCDQIKLFTMRWCNMPQALVDKILSQVDGFGTSNGTISLLGSEMPSATGLAHKISLESRGWTVEVSGPRIQVRGNDVEIANNDITPSATDNTDFGTSTISGSVVHSFTIRNDGQADLHLTGTPRVAISGPNSADFSVTTQPSASISPWGNSSNFQITFSPTGAGLRQATVTITNNGIDYKTSYTFTIQGTGPTPNYWNGTGNWDNAANWSGGVPTSSSIAIIQSGTVTVNGNYSLHALTIQPEASLTVGSGNSLSVASTLTIQSNASNTGSLINNGTLTVSGLASVERYLTANAWHIVAPPVSGQTVASFLTSNGTISANPGNTNQRAMKTYNETTNLWNALLFNSSPGNTTAGDGFAVWPGSNGLVNFTGNIQTGATDVAVVKNGYGWNCIGNPYTSAIAINTNAGATNFINSNSSLIDPSYAAIYVWEQGLNKYSIINQLSDTFFAAVGQGFFVKAATGGDIHFTPAMQSHQTASTFKSKSTLPSIVISATTKEKSSTAQVLFTNGSSKGLDVGFDAGIMRTGFDVYTKLADDNGVDFGIQCLPLGESYTIPVGIESTEGESVNLQLATSNLPSNCTATFEDRERGTTVPISKSTQSIVVDVQANSNLANRFYLQVSSASSTTGMGNWDNKLVITTGKGQINISGVESSNGTATIYDVQGRKLSSIKLNSQNTNTISTEGLRDGIYLLRVNQVGETITRKVSVKN